MKEQNLSLNPEKKTNLQSVVPVLSDFFKKIIKITGEPAKAFLKKIDFQIDFSFLGKLHVEGAKAFKNLGKGLGFLSIFLKNFKKAQKIHKVLHEKYKLELLDQAAFEKGKFKPGVLYVYKVSESQIDLIFLDSELKQHRHSITALLHSKNTPHDEKFSLVDDQKEKIFKFASEKGYHLEKNIKGLSLPVHILIFSLSLLFKTAKLLTKALGLDKAGFVIKASSALLGLINLILLHQAEKKEEKREALRQKMFLKSSAFLGAFLMVSLLVLSMIGVVVSPFVMTIVTLSSIGLLFGPKCFKLYTQARKVDEQDNVKFVKFATGILGYLVSLKAFSSKAAQHLTSILGESFLSSAGFIFSSFLIAYTVIEVSSNLYSLVHLFKARQNEDNPDQRRIFEEQIFNRVLQILGAIALSVMGLLLGPVAVLAFLSTVIVVRWGLNQFYPEWKNIFLDFVFGKPAAIEHHIPETHIQLNKTLNEESNQESKVISQMEKNITKKDSQELPFITEGIISVQSEKKEENSHSDNPHLIFAEWAALPEMKVNVLSSQELCGISSESSKSI